MAGPFYVQPGIGADVNAGTSRGAGNSWATFQKAADTAAAGEIVYLEGTETIAAAIDFDTNAGDETSGMIRFIGTNTSGVNDGTRYIVDCNSNNIDGIVFTNTCNLIYFENIEIKNSGNGDGISHAGTVSLYCVFINCCANNNGGAGLYMYRWSRSIFIRCVAYSNTLDGLQCGSGNNKYFFCCCHDNTQSGFEMVYDVCAMLVGCLSYDNTNDGFESLYLTATAFNCVSEGNTDDGISCRSTTNGFLALIGCRVTNHSGAGDIGVNANTEILLHGWNYFENNDGANIQNATLAIEIPYNGAATDAEDQADTNEGYVSLTDGSENLNLRDDATSRRTAITIPTV